MEVDTMAGGEQDLRWEVEYLAQYDVVQVTAVGTLTLNALSSLIPAGMAECEARGTNKTLIDYRGVTLDFATVDIYHAPSVSVEAGLPHSYLVAFICPADAKSLADFAFYETRAVNTGFQHKIFSDKGAALDWLQGGASQPGQSDDCVSRTTPAKESK